MYIKRLVIEGFKSYKERTVLEFGPKHNVVVGKNGAGKSNVFAAIAFVLSDRYSNMRADERQRLLHEGSGRPPLSAYVELTFDNTSRRFPEDKDEVLLKRVIGLKKDEYLLNNKHISKSQLENLLESAGFSRSNPYNIVQQGKVAALLKMTDAQRLQLLKEIAGTRVYDQRREESLKVMKDANSCRAQVAEISNSLEERLQELEEEQAELKDYQECDSKRRALEYAIFTKEKSTAEKKLEAIDLERTELHNQSKDVHEQSSEIREQREHLEVELAELDVSFERSLQDSEQVHKEHQLRVHARARLQLQVEDYQKQQERVEKSVQDTVQEMETLQHAITSSENELKDVALDYDKKKNEECEIIGQLEQTKERIDEIYAKQGRCRQYRSKKQRDEFLNSEIAKRVEIRTQEQARLQDARAQLQAAQAKMKQYKKTNDQSELELSEAKKQLSDANQQLKQLKEDREVATNARKELWREDAQQGTGLDQFKRALQRAERQLYATMPRDIRMGIERINEFVSHKKLKGVHGMLIELFDVDSKFEKCVETTAGNRLFHVVVDDDEVGAKILQMLKHADSGRITVIPLSRLDSREPQYQDSSDAIPMLSRLHFDQRIRAAFIQIFGKTVIVRNLQLGAEYAKKHKISAITLDGDQVSRKGALTGGFIDLRASRMKAWRETKAIKAKIDAICSSTDGVKARALQKDQEVSLILGEMQKCEANRRHLRDRIASLIDDLESSKKELHILQNDILAKERACENHTASIAKISTSILGLDQELSSPFRPQLSSQEISELETLSKSISALEKRGGIVTQQRIQVELKKHELENRLNSNLLVRMDELRKAQQEISESTETFGDSSIDDTIRDLESCDRVLEEISDKKKHLEETLEHGNIRRREILGQLDDLKNENNKLQATLSNESRSMERLLNKRALLQQKKEDCERNILGLGSLPFRAWETYGHKRLNDLMNLLKKTNADLKKYSHVNKKAIDQFVTFTEQRRMLASRKDELDRGKEAIEELVEHLDLKKDAAIRRTFKGIAKHFAQVFTELVPGGRATLVMQTSKELDENGGDEDNEEEEGRPKKRRIAADHYSGVGIKVTFHGGGETYLMQQLSGGQQTVVALALIFAIQRCDPFPFYLFDEIDSNLDSAHRAAVAQLISHQSNLNNDNVDENVGPNEAESHERHSTTQFICTTFRPEMLSTASTFFGVVYSNKVSLVKSIDRDSALRILEQNEKEVESSMAGSINE